MLLVDLTHTSHTPANTGIQRLARSLFGALSRQTPTTPVCLDPYARAWRPLDSTENAIASGQTPVGKHRGSKWTTTQKLRGWAARAFGSPPLLPEYDGFVCPELFSPAVARSLPGLFARTTGPRVAFFFDAIPLTHPEYTPAKTVARFPGFMQELLQFDGVAAISQTSADALTGYWHWLGIRDHPEVTVVPLGADIAAEASPIPDSEMPQMLCVSSIEGRKNHLALLEAAERLWREGLRFELRLVGLPRPETAQAALAAIDRLKAEGHPLRFDGVLDEPALRQAWRECSFSVYPSLTEGFGLPVIESLARGRPCICAASGATGELVAGGGCIGVQPADAGSFATAIRSLLTSETELRRLGAEAGRRPVPSWDDCATRLRQWMSTLPRRP